MSQRKSVRNALRAAALSAVVAVSLAACSTGGTSSGSSTDGSSGGTVAVNVGLDQPINVPAGKPKIAVFMTGGANTLGQTFIETVKQISDQQGLDINVFDGKFDPQVQFDQVQSAITSGRYNAFVLVANDPNGICDLATKDAPAAGIAVVAVAVPLCGRAFDDADQLYAPGTVGYISGQSDKANFNKWAAEIRKVASGPQKALFVTGPEILPSSVNSSDPFKAIAASDPSFKVTVKHGQYSQQSAQDATANLLIANPDVTMVVTDYTDLTKGAVQALREAGKTGVKVYDYGGGQDAVQLLKDNRIELTFPYVPKQWASVSIQTLIDAFNGKSVQQINTLGLDGPIITRENVGSFTPEY